MRSPFVSGYLHFNEKRKIKSKNDFSYNKWTKRLPEITSDNVDDWSKLSGRKVSYGRKKYTHRSKTEIENQIYSSLWLGYCEYKFNFSYGPRCPWNGLLEHRRFFFFLK